MIIVQTIELTDAERLCIEKYLKIIDEISDKIGKSMDEVSEYFLEHVDIVEDDKFSIASLHNIEDF